jgi:hypoxanthine-guanine phosphoribosyltransferase
MQMGNRLYFDASISLLIWPSLSQRKQHVADLVHIRRVMAQTDCLHSETEVEAAIDGACKINAETRERNPVVFCVMNGGLVSPAANQAEFRWSCPTCRYVMDQRRRSGWKAKPEISFIDRDVLIIDDILDEGHTLGTVSILPPRRCQCVHRGADRPFTPQGASLT